METLTRLVSESLARHGFNRPLDYRRLQWSRWFRCESHHSLLCVPSKPGVFALAEELMDFGETHVGTAAVGCPAGERPADLNREEYDFSRAEKASVSAAALAAVSPQAGSPKPEGRRMLAVTGFFEDDDMAFVLDRMLSRNHPMRARLESGHYFVRFVEIQDQAQRRGICSALNQWIASSAEKATGIGSHFASSLELTPATEQSNSQGNVARTCPGRESKGPSPANAEIGTPQTTSTYPDHSPAKKLSPLEAVTATTVQRIPVFPSGF